MAKETQQQKEAAWFQTVLGYVQEEIALGELNADTLDIYDYLKTEFRAGTPEDVFERLCDFICKKF